MQAISLNLFATQQQSNNLKNLNCKSKFKLLYLKFSEKFNELSPNFLKQAEVAKKWQKLSCSGKIHLYVFLR